MSLLRCAVCNLLVDEEEIVLIPLCGDVDDGFVGVCRSHGDVLEVVGYGG